MRKDHQEAHIETRTVLVPTSSLSDHHLLASCMILPCTRPHGKQTFGCLRVYFTFVFDANLVMSSVHGPDTGDTGSEPQFRSSNAWGHHSFVVGSYPESQSNQGAPLVIISCVCRIATTSLSEQALRQIWQKFVHHGSAMWACLPILLWPGAC